MAANLANAEKKLVDLVRRRSEPLPSLDHGEAFVTFFDRFADADIVLLGEATHGTSEFYRARAVITRQLVEKHRFRILAIEGDWPDAAELGRYVRQHAAEGYYRAMYQGATESWNLRDSHMFDTLVRVLHQRGPDAKAIAVAARHSTSASP